MHAGKKPGGRRGRARTRAPRKEEEEPDEKEDEEDENEKEDTTWCDAAPWLPRAGDGTMLVGSTGGVLPSPNRRQPT